jgi:transcriptional regulator with XRE-family HTH domain
MISPMTESPGQAPLDQGWPAFIQYYLDLTGWKPGTLAARAGIDRSLPGRWLSMENGPKIESIRQICRALGVDSREGLIAAGLFTAEDLGYGPNSDIQLFSERQLLAELSRRMNRHLPHGPMANMTLVDETVVARGNGYHEDLVVVGPIPDDDDDDASAVIPRFQAAADA